VASELVNRIQNRRKDQNYAISDKIEVTLFSASEVFKQAVAENEAYIAGETQAVAIKWAAAADGLEANDADGEAFCFTTVKA
jgi:isoleucyl-tRNA synthetase